MPCPASGRIPDARSSRRTITAASKRSRIVNTLARYLLRSTAMSEPRRVVPGRTWLLTRRCTQRQFLLTPDRKINNAFLYCLIEAAQKYNIVLLLSQMMSNHQHTPFYDPNGMAVEFMHRFHTHLARCVNAYRGRWENMWSSTSPSLVELEDIDDVVDKLIYTAINPIKHNL